MAADFAVDLAPVEIVEPEMCQVAELETETDATEEQSEILDLDATEIEVDVVDDSIADDGVIAETEVTDEVVDAEAEVEVDAEVGTESSAHDLGDPVDGTDGFFGSIEAENPSQTFTFSPSEDGMINIVVASSFGDAETRMEVTDSNGDVVAATMTEEVSGFQTLSFEAEAGAEFELNVSSKENAEGFFQVTVGHSEIPQPVDLHVDAIGADSSELEFVDGSTEVQGDLELAGDVDTFQFTADESGKISLGLAELNADNATELEVQVFGADGTAITRGITNETVGISFDVEGGSEYFLAISAGEGETGTYQLDMSLAIDAVNPEVEVIAETEVETQPEAEPELTDCEIVDANSDAEVEAETGDDPGLEAEAAGDDAEVVTDDGDVAINPEVDAASEVDGDSGPVDDADETAGDIADETAGDEVDGEAVAEAEPEVVIDTDATAEPECEIDSDDAAEVVDSDVEAETPLADPEAGTPEVVVDDQADPVDGQQDASDPANLNDAIDDVPAFDVADSEAEEDLNVDAEQPAIDPVDDEPATGVAVVADSSIDDLVDEEMEICFSDLDAKQDFVDSFFAEFDPESVFRFDIGFEFSRR
ncbi:midas domain-containing protein [Mariniblastus fucicola]|uniref:hypothetical protein n=1 Tax=Mariniblastus fucicola TaxID=980251 RepID=UPI0011E02E5C|nr:hypothetical protein [Mariniblastus fucicola]